MSPRHVADLFVERPYTNYPRRAVKLKRCATDGDLPASGPFREFWVPEQEAGDE
jgi:hypothetical protein